MCKKRDGLSGNKVHLQTEDVQLPEKRSVMSKATNLKENQQGSRVTLPSATFSHTGLDSERAALHPVGHQFTKKE